MMSEQVSVGQVSLPGKEKLRSRPLYRRVWAMRKCGKHPVGGKEEFHYESFSPCPEEIEIAQLVGAVR